MSKVVAIGGKHKSASSFLSQAMADQTVKNVVIFTFHENGETEFAHFECTHQQLAWAALCIQQQAYGD